MELKFFEEERAAIMAVYKEMSEADEPNLLEEEDMHVFDQQPLRDKFSLVSCNLCKKPIKMSQYSAHAERCRSLLEGGFNEKTVRKARIESDVSMSDDASGSTETGSDRIPGCVSSKLGKSKYLDVSQHVHHEDFSNDGHDGPKVGRPRKMCFLKDLMDEDYMGSGTKRKRTFVPLSVDELDTMCGVPSPRSGAPCRQALTCKSHSMSSKRSVIGRRKPFDVLLQGFKDGISSKAQSRRRR